MLFCTLVVPIEQLALDEIPQIFNIIAGQMSIIGPRPALWNQYDLIAERDKYGANDIKPGLTGWAQINGRDELVKVSILCNESEFSRESIRYYTSIMTDYLIILNGRLP